MASRTSVRFDLDEIRLAAKLTGMTERAQFALDSQVLRDTTDYVPFAEGVLSGSGQRASDVGHGVIAWSTPYAAAQYYGLPNKSGAVHPNATMEWFEVAKRDRLRVWVDTAKKAARLL